MHSLSIGPFGLATEYVLLWGSLLLGLAILRCFRQPKALRQSAESTLFYLFAGGILGARIGFVMRMWASFNLDVVAMLDIRDGGFMPSAGVFVAVIILLYRLQRAPLTRTLVIQVILITCTCIFPVYAWISLQHRDVRMPEPELTTLAGNHISLANFTQRPVVINFWATWCPPCRRELPVFAAAQKQYKNVNFVFINQSESRAKVAAFMQEQEVNLDNLLLDEGAEAGSQFGVAVLPTTLFYTKDGQLVYRHVGGVSQASLDYAMTRFVAQLDATH